MTSMTTVVMSPMVVMTMVVFSTVSATLTRLTHYDTDDDERNESGVHSEIEE